MKDQIVDRLKLWHELRVRNLSDTTIEAITQIIERTRIEQGHSKAESVAKEIRELIETGISESGLLEKLKQMEKQNSRSTPDEQMSLEAYKQKVWECLRKNYKHSIQTDEELMKLYENDFQEFLDDKWEPSLAATAMVMSY